MAREQAREEKEREKEQAREEKEREKGLKKKVEREEGEEKSESWRRRQRRPWRVGGDDPWGVPTYPGAWTANLQLPCGSGLTREELLPAPFGRLLREWLVRSGN